MNNKILDKIIKGHYPNYHPEDSYPDYSHITILKKIMGEYEQESNQVEVRVSQENGGELLIKISKIYYDSLIDCCNKLLDAYENQNQKELNKYKMGLRILLKR